MPVRGPVCALGSRAVRERPPSYKFLSSQHKSRGVRTIDARRAFVLDRCRHVQHAADVQSAADTLEAIEATYGAGCRCARHQEANKYDPYPASRFSHRPKQGARSDPER